MVSLRGLENIRRGGILERDMSKDRKLTVGIVAWKLHFIEQRALLLEGHRLRVLPEPNPQPGDEIGDISGLGQFFPGQIEVVRTPEELCDGADIIIADWIDISPETIDAIHRLHPYVIGLDNFTQRLESDRGFGRMLASDIGLDIASEGRWVSTEEEALVFLSQAEGRVLFKSTSGRVMPTLRPDTREDAEDLITTDPFGWFTADEPGVFMDTEMKGQEISYFGFWGGDDWLDTFGLTVEHKEALAGGEGRVLTGETGTALRFFRRAELPPRWQAAFTRLASVLRETYYRGFVDLNTLVLGDEIRFMEFTCRPGYPTEQEIISVLWHQGKSYGHWLAGMAGLMDEVKIATTWAVGITLNAHGVGMPGVSSATGDWHPLLRWHDRLELVTKSSFIQPMYCYWDDEGRWRTNYLDRFVCAVGINRASLLKARTAARLAIASVSAWGHTYRRDIASNEEGLTNFILEFIHLLPADHKPIDVRKERPFSVADVTEGLYDGTESFDWLCMVEWLSYAEDERWNRHFLDLLCETWSYRVYFAREHGESGNVLGMLITRRWNNLVYVANVAVLPSARKRGVARALYAMMEEDNPDARFAARPKSVGSEAFHDAMGWQVAIRRGATYFLKNW